MLNAGLQGDVRLYESVASDLFAGKLPYRDRVLEYPPYAIPIFVLPHLFGGGNYSWVFMLVVFTAELVGQAIAVCSREKACHHPIAILSDMLLPRRARDTLFLSPAI